MSHKFVNNFNTNKDDTVSYFYQLAEFPDKKRNGLHDVRVFVINSKNEFIDIKNFMITPQQYHNLIKSKKKHQYQIFSVYNLSIVDYPHISHILVSKSDILRNNHNYSGYAPF